MSGQRPPDPDDLADARRPTGLWRGPRGWSALSPALAKRAPLAACLERLAAELYRTIQREPAWHPLTRDDRHTGGMAHPHDNAMAFAQSVFVVDEGRGVRGRWHAEWSVAGPLSPPAVAPWHVVCSPVNASRWQSHVGGWLPGWIHDALQPLSSVAQRLAAIRWAARSLPDDADLPMTRSHFQAIERAVTQLGETLGEWRQLAEAHGTAAWSDISEVLDASVRRMHYLLRQAGIETEWLPLEENANDAPPAAIRRSAHLPIDAELLMLSALDLACHLALNYRRQLALPLDDATPPIRLAWRAAEDYNGVRAGLWHETSCFAMLQMAY